VTAHRHNCRNEVVKLTALLKLACSELMRRGIDLPVVLDKWYRAQRVMTQLRKGGRDRLTGELTVERVQQLLRQGVDLDNIG